MNQFLIALCGLPASGKSSLADQIVRTVESPIDIVRTDEWRTEEYYRDWAPEKEGSVREKALVRTEELIASGKSVIHDDTNYYKSMRHELFEIAKNHGCVFAVVHVTTPLKVALRWNNERENSRVDESIIRSIAERFDTPGGRYLWDMPVAEVDMSSEDPQAVSAFLIEIIEELPPAREPRPVRVTQTAAEQIDVFTREIVTEFLSEHPEYRISKEVTMIRRAVLSKAIEDNMSARAAGQMLRKELSDLLSYDLSAEN